MITHNSRKRMSSISIDWLAAVDKRFNFSFLTTHNTDATRYVIVSGIVEEIGPFARCYLMEQIYSCNWTFYADYIDGQEVIIFCFLNESDAVKYRLCI
jgi:hypothetical protein